MSHSHEEDVVRIKKTIDNYLKTLVLLHRSHVIFKKIDTVLDSGIFEHSTSCRLIVEEYYDCKCGLGDLETIQLQEIEPLLQAIKEHAEDLN